MTDHTAQYQAPELHELGSFEGLTLGGGFIHDEGDDGNEVFFGSTTS